MKCPTDDTLLVMTERSGIEIDYCPQCRGVWLDRGELDKIIERAASPAPQAAAPAQPAFPVQPAYPAQPGFNASGWDRGRGDGDRDRFVQSQGGYSDGRRRKKDNWLSELFD
jgi:Zn-finger nucleic acid-binding protein